MKRGEGEIQGLCYPSLQSCDVWSAVQQVRRQQVTLRGGVRWMRDRESRQRTSALHTAPAHHLMHPKKSNNKKLQHFIGRHLTPPPLRKEGYYDY